MAIKGIFASDSGSAGERKQDFTGGLIRYQANGTAPLLAMSSGMKSRDAMDTIITWFEENFNTGRVSITNNASTSTSISVSTADANNVVAGEIYLIEASGELVFVTAISGTTLTVERGFAAGIAATAVDGSSVVKPMQRIGTAFEEGSSMPVAKANIGYPVFNYTQIFRNKWDVTGTAGAVQFLTGNKVAKNKKDAANFHAEDIERSSIWGRKTVGVKNNKAFRTMNGLLSFIATNITSQSTTVSYTEMRDFIRDVYLYNIQGEPNERVALCGNNTIGVLDTLSLYHGEFKMEAGQTEFGMDIYKWRTPFGTISLKTHPLMNINPLFTQELYVFHPGAFEWRWLRKTHTDNYDTDGTRAGVDANYGVYTSELSLAYVGEKTAGKFTGITAADTTGF